MPNGMGLKLRLVGLGRAVLRFEKENPDRTSGRLGVCSASTDNKATWSQARITAPCGWGLLSGSSSPRGRRRVVP